MARLSQGCADVKAAQRLRYSAFRPAHDPGIVTDSDAYDDTCKHMLVEDLQTDRVVCCYRILLLDCGKDVLQSYSAQFYDLTRLRVFAGPMIEMGRFCVAPDCHAADVLRLAWGAMAQVVDDFGAEFLFGCSSFRGTDPTLYADAFAYLKQRHLAPDEWHPGHKAPLVHDYGTTSQIKPNVQKALAQLPPLLRTYLVMGGWVSDHAVIDPAMNTLHVFTGLPIQKIPAARARALRLVALQS